MTSFSLEIGPLSTSTIVNSINSVIVDALDASLLSVETRKASHIRRTEDANLGTTDLFQVRINGDKCHFGIWSVWRFTPVDMLSPVPFKNATVAKFVVDSPFVPGPGTIANSLRNSSQRMEFQS